MTDISRDLGKLQSDVENLDVRLEKLEEKVDDIHTVITKARGGWLLLILIGGGLSWAITTIWPLIKKGF